VAYTGPTRVAIVEDHPLLRDGLALLLGHSGYIVVGTAGTAAEGFDLVVAERPDVLVLGLVLADQPGTSLARRVLAVLPQTRLLIYTGVQRADELESVLACGAHGVLSKSAGPAELREALRTVAAGGTHIDDRLRTRLTPSADQAPAGRLSKREREVVALLASGLTLEQIGGMLELSTETVRTHVRNAGRRLGGRTRAHTIALALRGGEVEA